MYLVLARSPFYRDDQVTAVVADLHPRHPVRLCRGEDKLIVALLRPDAVEEDPQRLVRLEVFGTRSGGLYRAVVKTRVVLAPHRLAELRPLAHVVAGCARRHVTDPPGVPVRAHHAGRVGEQRAVTADIDLADGDCAVLRQGIGVEQKAPA